MGRSVLECAISFVQAVSIVFWRSMCLFVTHLTFRNPVTYRGALEHLSLSETPQKAAMVAAHIYDLRAAAKVGLRTIYVPRPGEDRNAVGVDVKSKAEGGEVDVVVQDFQELARLFQ